MHGQLNKAAVFAVLTRNVHSQFRKVGGGGGGGGVCEEE